MVQISHDERIRKASAVLDDPEWITYMEQYGAENRYIEMT